jgi:hypothetical protein
MLQPLLEIYRQAPSSLDERTQCRMHEELLRLSVLWSAELKINGTDQQSKLGAGLGIVRGEAIAALARRDAARISAGAAKH